jgi:hypothetical protein
MGMPDMKAQHIMLTLEGAEPRFEIQSLEFDPRPPEDPGEHPTNLRQRGYNHSRSMSTISPPVSWLRTE